MSEHSKQSYDDMNTTKLLMAAVFGVLGTIALVVWLRAFYFVQDTAFENERLTRTPYAAQKQKDEWQESLGSFGKIDAETNTVSVPIERGIQAFLEERQAH